MDELGFNKIAGAVLLTALGFLGVRTLADFVVPENDFEAVYLPEVDLGGGEAVVEDADPTFNHPDFIAAMDVTAGAKVFKKCQSCHNAEAGGANGTGPNLYNVMGRQMGVHPGFAYSSAMQGRAAPWTWEEMNGFLIKPKEWIPGTAMNYIGLKKWEDRAAVMAYLNAQASNPLPMPTPAAVEAVDVVEVGDLPDSDPGSEVLVGEDAEDATMARITDESRPIPGLEEVEPLEAAQEALAEDLEDRDRDAVEATDDFQSAGNVEPDDLTPVVADVVDGTSDEAEVDDGPMDADDVMKFLERRGDG